MGRLEIEAQRLLDLSIAPNTRKAYKTAWDAYEKMRSELGAQAILPVSRSDLISFIAHLSVTGKAAATISAYVSGISFLHKSKNLDDPADCFLVRKMLEGCRRDKPYAPDSRRPLTFNLLKASFEGMSSVCVSVYEACMFQAALLLAFFGFLRVSEFTAQSKNRPAGKALQIDDIAILDRGRNAGRCIHLRIRFSKTDQRGRSTTLIIPKTGNDVLCPVNSLSRYLNMRSPGEGQLFWHFDKSPLTRYQFAAILKRSLAVKQALNTDIKTHSIRIGACTHFARAGCSEQELMSMGRWSSAAYQRYIRIAHAS